jgi:adenylyl-sulfate kinase
MPVEVFDGDEVRAYLSTGLGFSKEDRDTNVLRIGYVARLLSKHGVAVVVAAIAPYAETRQRVRDSIGSFIEVHVDCPLDELVRRDPKGLYKKALAGQLDHFTGVTDPYEIPENPEVRVHSDRQTVEESLAAIIDAIECRSLIPSPVEQLAD